MDMWSKN